MPSLCTVIWGFDTLYYFPLLCFVISYPINNLLYFSLWSRDLYKNIHNWIKKLFIWISLRPFDLPGSKYLRELWTSDPCTIVVFFFFPFNKAYSCLLLCRLVIPPESEASWEVANLTGRKNLPTAVYREDAKSTPS